VRDLFEQGKKNAPCLIFIDEIDAVGRHRGAGMGGGHDEREQTLNQLLVEMDGFEANDGVIIIAATNRPDVLDPALLRPGRFDRRVVVNKPDLKGRKQILDVHIRKTPVGPDVDVEKLARGTPGFSGADLENLVNEAALIAARADKKYLDMEDFEKAKDKVMMGSERKSMVMDEEDRRITAYHEAGHTLVGKKLAGIDPIHKVTIIPRGMALGVTQTLPEKDSFNLSRKKAINMISFLFGGRAAEELVFQDITTGAGNDIERATDIARRMVTEWGMSDKLGPLAYEKREGPVFLGMQSGRQRDYSDSKAQEIDAEVFSLIDNGYKTALQILKDHRDALERLAMALLEYETIDGVEVDMLVNGAAVSEIGKMRANKSIGSQGGGAALPVADKAPSGGSDPVGNSGPVTV
jgi:cell division protease FtsH